MDSMRLRIKYVLDSGSTNNRLELAAARRPVYESI